MIVCLKQTLVRKKEESVYEAFVARKYPIK